MAVMIIFAIQFLMSLISVGLASILVIGSLVREKIVK